MIRFVERLKTLCCRLFLAAAVFSSQASVGQMTASFGYWHNASVPKLVQHKSGVAQTSSVGATFTSSVTAGNMLIACSYFEPTVTSSAISDNQNDKWIQIGWYLGVSGDLYCWYAPTAVGGSTTVTVTTTGTSPAVYLTLFEVSGGYNVLDQWGVKAGTGSTITVSTNGSVQNPNEYVFAAAADTSQNSTWTQGAGYTIHEQINDPVNGDSMAAEDKNSFTSLSGVQTATFTKTLSGDDTLAFIFTFSQSPVKLVQAFPILSDTNLNGTQVSFAIPATGSGNLLVMTLVYGSNCVSQSTVSISDNASSGGNSYTSAGAYAFYNARGSTEIWYAPNSKSGGTTVTLTVGGTCNSANSPDVTFLEISGMATSSPIDGSPSVVSNPTSSATVTGPTVTTTKARSVVVSVASAQNAIQNPNITTVFDSLALTPGSDDSAIYFPVATGTYGALWTQSASGKYCASAVAFKAK